MAKPKLKKKQRKEYYPPEPYKRAFYVLGGCGCSGCLVGLGHIIGYRKL